MDRSAFEGIVGEVVSHLPAQFREALSDTAIVVEDMPAGGRKSLLGLYEGVPLTAWGRGHAENPPDKITLYKNNIEACARSEEEVPHVIRETLLHEIAHYFGFDHDRIHKMEQRWRNNRKQE